MRNSQNGLLMRGCVLAVRGALAALVMVPCAYAAEPENDDVRALTQPVSKVELGVGYVNHASAKFGEYNGLVTRAPTVSPASTCAAAPAMTATAPSAGAWWDAILA